MSRSADYTIQGFIYQFNKTLLEVLKDEEGSEIAIEGIIEDIEVKSEMVTNAIQCKYHESQEKFTTSCIYKPVLQMMNHYHDNPTANVEYRLYAHFPNEAVGATRTLTDEETVQMLASVDKTLKKYIEKVKGKVEVGEFCKRFTLEFGPSLEGLIVQVQEALISNGMSEGDIDTLVYPNSVQLIADLSILHDPTRRVIRKEDLLSSLVKIKKTAITRWTKELRTLDKLLKSRRAQLKGNLAKNSRSRYLIISEQSIDNFNEVIVTFISEYLNMYHFKAVHDKTPLFCLDCSWETFKNILVRLYRKQIKVNTGLIADVFDKSLFNEGPFRLKIRGGFHSDFHLRLLRYNGPESIEILNETKCEDCFVFMKQVPENLDVEDLNVEHIELNEIEKIKFIMGMCEVYE